MIKITNVVTDEILEFDVLTCPDYAVMYGHCVESNKLASWFFSASPDERKKTLKVYNGKKTISCGDWVYRKD